MHTWLSSLVTDKNTRAGKYFDLVTQAVIALSLILFTLETVPELASYAPFFELAEAVIIIFFTVEYVLRFAAAGSKRAYIFSFYGIIDLLSILPFFLTLGVVDLRFVRIFRLFRLLRLFKLTRYTHALNRLKRAVDDIKEELILYVVFTLLLIYLSSIGIYYFENQAQPEKFRSVIDSMWWAIATLTTVGYGDIFPITAGGKLFTFFLLLIGLGFVSVPSALLAAALTRQFRHRNDEQPPSS